MKRPWWRRAGGSAKRAGYRLWTPFDRLLPGRADPLLPPAHLRVYYYRSLRPEAFRAACKIVKTELLSHGLQPHHRVLDIGSGIGNLPIALLDWLRGSYDGIEVHREAVEWCQRAITPRHPSFRFHRADLTNTAYNPHGAAAAAGYRFPFPDRGFDVIFLGSVFTHLPLEAVAHYLREIARMLAPGGMCVASYFLLNEQTRAGVRAATSFISFDVADPAERFRLHDAAVPEAAIAFDEPLVGELHEKAGLAIRDIRRGRWWSGAAHDQDVVTACILS